MIKLISRKICDYVLRIQFVFSSIKKYQYRIAKILQYSMREILFIRIKSSLGLNFNIKLKRCPSHNLTAKNFPTLIQKEPIFRDLKLSQCSHPRSSQYQSWLLLTSSKTAFKSWPKWKKTGPSLIYTKATWIAFKPLLSKRMESRPCGKETLLRFYFHFQALHFRWRLEVSGKNKSPKCTNQPHPRAFDTWSTSETSPAWYLPWEVSF